MIQKLPERKVTSQNCA